MTKAKAKKTVASLSKFQAQAEEIYESYKINVGETTVRLFNPIRIAPEARERVFELAKLFEFEDEHEFGVDDLKAIHPAILEVLELVGDDNVFYLIEAIRNDLVVAMNVFTDYFENINMGEASSSES